MKKVALELGGKNPNIVFADADLEVALDFALTAVFLHSGQVCSAGARLLVEESIHDDVRRRARRAGRPDPARRPVRREGRDRAADQRRAPRQGRGVRRRRARRGRRAPLRRRAARRPRPGRRLLLPADGPGPLHQRDVGDPGRVVRPGADRRDVPRRGRGGRDRQRQHLRARRRGLDPGRRQGASGSPAGCGWARSGSTTTTPTCRRPSGAATSSPASGGSSGIAGLDEYRETKHVWHNIRPAVAALVRAGRSEGQEQGA